MHMKNLTKFLLSMVIILTFAVPAFATTGWDFDQTKQDWRYYDVNGNVVKNEWKQSNGKTYFLGADGYLAHNQLVTVDNGSYKFVCEDGFMLENSWVKISKSDDKDLRYMYFGSNGKAEESGWRTINDKRYHFTDYYMDYGFLDDNGSMLDQDEDDVWKNTTYYCGSSEDGARFSGWLKVQVTDDNKDSYVYFDSNGKKVKNTTKVIDGKKYRFDADGKMLTEWYSDAATASEAKTNFFNEDGSLRKTGWVYTTAQDDEDGDEHWYYAKDNGSIYKNVVKKINGKYYAFDDTGIMLTGFVHIDTNDMSVIDQIDADDMTADFASIGDYMFFTESFDPNQQGAAVTNKTKIETKDGYKTFKFNSRGIAYAEGIKVEKDYYYIDSILQLDEDASVKYKPLCIGDKWYIWTLKSGKVSTKGSFVDNDNDVKYVIKNNEITEYHKEDGKWVET